MTNQPYLILMYRRTTHVPLLRVDSYIGLARRPVARRY
jgi:hypothetical protein